MKTEKRLSKKVKQAANYLGDEHISDLGQDCLLNQVKKGKVTPHQLYKAMHHFGYRWHRGHWVKTNPRWLQSLINQENKKTTSGW